MTRRLTGIDWFLGTLPDLRTRRVRVTRLRPRHPCHAWVSNFKHGQDWKGKERGTLLGTWYSTPGEGEGEGEAVTEYEHEQTRDGGYDTKSPYKEQKSFEGFLAGR